LFFFAFEIMPVILFVSRWSS